MIIFMFLALTLLAILLFGPWGLIGAVLVGLAILISQGSSTSKDKDRQRSEQQAAAPKQGSGWKGMANRKLTPREIELREMDTGS